jgi:hypothetical protein
MQYLVLAHDGRDSEAKERRRRVREKHLEGVRPAVESGVLQLGGALLDDGGGMVGSALLVEADDERALRTWLENDIYHREGVWKSFEIYPFRRAV